MPQYDMDEFLVFTILKLGMFSRFLLFILYLFTKYRSMARQKYSKSSDTQWTPSEGPVSGPGINSRKTMSVVSKADIQHPQI